MSDETSMRPDDNPSTPVEGAAPSRRPGSTSRRAFLVGGSALLMAGVPAIRSTAAGPLPAKAATLRSLSEVRAEAIATAGVRLRNSPWLPYFGGVVTDWSAMYISWLLRGNGAPKTTDIKDLYDAFANKGLVGPVPRTGSLIFYSNGDGEEPNHVGFVESVTGQLPQTVEGNNPENVAIAERFVRRYAVPWDRRATFAYPVYG
jgi:hypothetical protein